MKKEDSTADVLFSFWLYMDNPLELFCTALSCADSTKKTPSRKYALPYLVRTVQKRPLVGNIEF